MTPRRNYFVTALVIAFIGLNILMLLIIRHRRRSDGSKAISSEQAAHRERSKSIENKFLEASYEIGKSQNLSEPILLRAKFDASEVGRGRLKETVAVQMSQVGKLDIQLSETRIMTSCAPDGSSATFTTSSHVTSGVFNNGPNVLEDDEFTECTIDHLGHKRVLKREQTTTVVHRPTKIVWFWPEAVSYPEEPVRTHETWVVNSDLPADAPTAVKKEPPCLTCSVEDRLLFEGVQCALIKCEGIVYALQDDAINNNVLDKYSITWRTYVDLSTGLDLWSEILTKHVGKKENYCIIREKRSQSTFDIK